MGITILRNELSYYDLLFRTWYVIMYLEGTVVVSRTTAECHKEEVAWRSVDVIACESCFGGSIAGLSEGAVCASCSDHLARHIPPSPPSPIHQLFVSLMKSLPVFRHTKLCWWNVGPIRVVTPNSKSVAEFFGSQPTTKPLPMTHFLSCTIVNYVEFSDEN